MGWIRNKLILRNFCSKLDPLNLICQAPCQICPNNITYYMLYHYIRTQDRIKLTSKRQDMETIVNLGVKRSILLIRWPLFYIMWTIWYGPHNMAHITWVTFEKLQLLRAKTAWSPIAAKHNRIEWIRIKFILACIELQLIHCAND